MKTSKLLITSLLAAAAMSVPAWANSYANQTISSDTTAIYTNNKYDNSNLVSGDTVINENCTWTWGTNNGSGHGLIKQEGTLSGAGKWLFTRTQTTDANYGRFLQLAGDNSEFTGTFQLTSSANYETKGPNVVLLLGSLNAATNATVDLGQCTGVAFAAGVTSANVGGFVGTSASSWILAKSFTPTGGTQTTNLDGSDWNADATVQTINLTGSGEYAFAGRVGNAIPRNGTEADVQNPYTLNINKAGAGKQTFSGLVALKDLSVSAGELVLSGTANIAGTATVTGGTLDLSGGTITLANAIQNSGTVTVSSETVFNLTRAESMTLVGGSGSISGYETLKYGNFIYNGLDIGRSTLTISANEITYNYVAAKALTWNGGATGGTWATTAAGTTATNTPWQNAEGGDDGFYTGDSVTFSTADASVEVSGTVDPAAMTVSAATRFTGTGTISVAVANLTTSAAMTLDENVVLDLGSISAATNKTISGTGTVKVVSSSTNNKGMPDHNGKLTLGSGFSGTIEYSGKFDTSNGTNNPNAKFALSNGSMWGGGTIRNDIHFLTNYQLGDSSATTIVLNGNLTQEAGTTLTIGTAADTNITFGGSATIGTLNQTAGTLTISGDGAKSVTNLTLSGRGMIVSGNLAVAREISVCKGATVTQSAGTVSATRLVLNDSDAEVASFYTLTGGVLNITGTGKAAGVTNNTTTTDNAVLIGHWRNGTSKLTVSGGTLNVTKGFTVISWDSAGTLEVSGGTANLYGVSLNTYRAKAANVTLSSGRLNLGAGGLTYGSGTNGTTNKTVTLSGGTLGALTDWSSDVAMSLSGNVTIDTTKQVVGADGASANAEGNVGASITLAGALSGDGASLTKAGAGTLTLRGANTYKGGTVIEAGTVVAGSASALGTTKGVEVKSGATLNLGTSAVTVAGLSGAGAVGLAAGTTSSTLTVNSATDSTFSGSIGGEVGAAISLVKQGAGTLELSGTNLLWSYGSGYGTVTVESGVLKVATSSSGTSVFGATTVNAGAKLEVATGVGAVALAVQSIRISENAMIVVDLSDYLGSADTFAVDLVATTALDYNGVRITSGNVDMLLEAIELKGWTQTGWAESLAYDGSTLSLTMTIPEPSAFGLLAGLGALALAGTRRRRRK